MMKFKRHIVTLLIVVAATICSRSYADVYLVSVGIADYPGTYNDLTFCDKDAKDITRIFKENTTVKYSQLLNEKATTKNVITAMNQLYAMAGKNDIVIFFYSGHGYEGGFELYDGRLDYDEVRQAMAGSCSENKMIFADACYAGKIRTNTPTTSSSNASSANDTNVMLFLSSRSDEVSREDLVLKNGLFAAYLQRALRGAADSNANRTITAKELYNYVHKHVVEDSYDSQHPVMWGKFPDNMPIIKW